ncbi:MAG: hypothetical protein K2W96_11650 [Gemmataceae bacterium]|nr:hypothetical protein [Gemmataceae bacterium]
MEVFAVDFAKWVDRVVAFRIHDARAVGKPFDECVLIVFADQHENSPDPTILAQIVLRVNVVEETMTIRKRRMPGEVPTGSDIRTVWLRHTQSTPDDGLVKELIGSVWRAEEGWRYGDPPLDRGCRGVGIHRDEISPWQENAIKAMEDRVE